MKDIKSMLNINKNVKDSRQLNVDEMDIYFTYADMLKLQQYLSRTYANFNGGFGLASDEVHVLQSKVEDDVTFSFTRSVENRAEAARNAYRKEFHEAYDTNTWSAYTCVDRYTWLEMLIIICKDLDIEFEYNRRIIDKITKL